MTIIDYFLCGVVFLFLISNIIYISKYYNLSSNLRMIAKRCVDKMYANHEKIRQELERKETSLQYKEKTINVEYNKLKDSFDKKYKDLESSFLKKDEEKDKELEEAIKETEEELQKSVEKVDELIGEKIMDLTLRNTLTFDCICGKKNIPCFIDLSKDNSFRCENCNSVYLVQAKFSPVIIGRASSEEEFAKIVENRLKEESDDEI